MTKKNGGFKFSIAGITENNLKNVDFSARSGEIVLISGVSGSGKTTLVKDVIAAEAQRQDAMRRKTDELHVYAVRPSFLRATDLPACTWVSQRALTQTELSTFGTRTGLKAELRKIFVENGRILYRNVEIKKPSLAEIRQFARRFHPAARLYAVLSAYTPIKASDVARKLTKHGITNVSLRDEKTGSIKEVSLANLPKIDLSNYEVVAAVETFLDDESVIELSARGILLLGADVALNFDEHYFYSVDGTIFRKPSSLLFSRSGASSLSGRCISCSGSGKKITANFDHVIDRTVPLQNGFLNVPLTKSGRYVAFKFLPSGLTTVLKKHGVDVSKSYDELSTQAVETIADVLTQKLLANQSDEHAARYLSQIDCRTCEGSGYGYQTRAVQINGKSFGYYCSLNAQELRAEISHWGLGEAAFRRLNEKLGIIEKLAIGHIGLDRATTTISSGEAQRVKLLEVLMSNDSGRIVVLDEPSSNLQYRDNLAILDAILQLKQQANCILIVEHNALYRSVADRIVEVGPGAGANGGNVRESIPSADQEPPYFVAISEQPSAVTRLKLRALPLEPKRNVYLRSISIPVGKITAVVGSSGSGKSTLVLGMMYSSLVDLGEPVMKLDSKPPGKSSASIVATYIEVFDDIRKVYSKAAAPYLNESDFSFNSSGACRACEGSGNDGDKLCGVCYGSRYRADVVFAKAEQISIVDLLRCNIDKINVTGAFGFLDRIRTVFEALSLSHITLGRPTSSLSGGELQRLKLAKFILNNLGVIGSGNATVILDEPSRGLDDVAVGRLHQALKEYMKGFTVVVIEHNPLLIYRCDYIIDLGQAGGDKTKNNIVVGQLGEKAFPSLNHAAVFAEMESIKAQYSSSGLNDAPGGVTQSMINGRRFHLLHAVYLQQKNFDLERFFSSDFQVDVSDKNFRFFHHRDEMEAALRGATVFLYNPFVAYLEKYERVPSSLQKAVRAEFRGREVYIPEDPWQTLVKANSFEEAFLKGSGVVATHRGAFPGSKNCQYYGIRLFSVKERLIDRISPAEFAFNLYRNSCPYCEGYGHIKSYPFEKWLDKRFSPLDPKMSSLRLHSVMPKSTINYFLKEQLFDFTVPAVELSAEEFNILLYGFKSYRFKKNGKAGVTEDDFWEWRGLNSYVYRNAFKLSPGNDLGEQLKWKKCPFCTYGFRNAVKKYCRDGKSIESFLKHNG